MDWESLDINQSVDNLSQANTKIPNLGNKEREKKKIAGKIFFFIWKKSEYRYPNTAFKSSFTTKNGLEKNT